MELLYEKYLILVSGDLTLGSVYIAWDISQVNNVQILQKPKGKKGLSFFCRLPTRGVKNFSFGIVDT